jgi:15,16-dihydrobiliverdin:ferredoxin oxidoreductase
VAGGIKLNMMPTRLLCFALVVTTYGATGFRPQSQRAVLKMDVGEMIDSKHNVPISQTLATLSLPSGTNIALQRVGVHLSDSIQSGADLTFVPFWEHQMKFMKDHLTDLQEIPVTDLDQTTDFAIAENPAKGARIVNLCFCCKEFRKIRMTYYDAGHHTQVFNSLWYPAEDLNLPLLGIDLLKLAGGKKYLAVVDFQPIHESQEKHAQPYEHLMKPIRQEYPSLQGQMSKRFYDENQFFSREMLFSRFEDAAIIDRDLMPAFRQYMDTYLQLVKTTTPEYNPAILDGHRAYDIYSAGRDPAIHMFNSMFGQEWADKFVHEFLFDMSR